MGGAPARGAQAALLHDTVEDTVTTIDELGSASARVADLVDWMTPRRADDLRVLRAPPGRAHRSTCSCSSWPTGWTTCAASRRSSLRTGDRLPTVGRRLPPPHGLAGLPLARGALGGPRRARHGDGRPGPAGRRRRRRPLTSAQPPVTEGGLDDPRIRPTVPGDDMGTANSSETARIEALLSAWSPTMARTCRSPAACTSTTARRPGISPRSPRRAAPPPPVRDAPCSGGRGTPSTGAWCARWPAKLPSSARSTSPRCVAATMTSTPASRAHSQAVCAGCPSSRTASASTRTPPRRATSRSLALDLGVVNRGAAEAGRERHEEGGRGQHVHDAEPCAGSVAQGGRMAQRAPPRVVDEARDVVVGDAHCGPGSSGWPDGLYRCPRRRPAAAR